MYRDIRHYVKDCTLCTATKRGVPQQPAPLKSRQPVYPWHTVSVKLMGPYPETVSGKRAILVVYDGFTRRVGGWLEEQVFSVFGYFEVVLSDNGFQWLPDRWEA